MPISDEPMPTKVLIMFYLMAVGVLRPAVHNTLLNIGNMSAIRCTSSSVSPVSTVDDLYCSQQCFTSRHYHSTCHTPPLQKATPFCHDTSSPRRQRGTFVM
ncbi:hypothetical protein MTO96_033868 [Rhipicephalus appendiculatus]